jgi:hypothetical protein
MNAGMKHGPKRPAACVRLGGARAGVAIEQMLSRVDSAVEKQKLRVSPYARSFGPRLGRREPCCACDKQPDEF